MNNIILEGIQGERVPNLNNTDLKRLMDGEADIDLGAL